MYRDKKHVQIKKAKKAKKKNDHLLSNLYIRICMKHIFVQELSYHIPRKMSFSSKSELYIYN